MAEKQFSEPEETTTGYAHAAPDKDMLTDEPVVERTHATAGGTGPVTPEWTPPPFAGETEAPPQAEKKSAFANPELEDLPPQEKQQAAFVAAGMMIDGYEMLWREIGNFTLPISNRKMNRLHEQKIIDLDMQVARRDGSITTPRKEIEDYNDDVTDAIQPDPDFKESVQPILAQELAKKNVGISPWQQIIFLTGMDCYSKVKEIRKVYSRQTELIEILRDMKNGVAAAQPAVHTAAAPVQPAQTIYEEQPAPQPPQQPQVFDTTNTSSAFEDIQAGRGGAGAVVPDYAIPQVPMEPIKTNKRKYTRPVGKGSRGPYKKKQKK